MTLEWVVTDLGATSQARSLVFVIERTSSSPSIWRGRVSSEWLDRINNEKFVSLPEAIFECDRFAKALLGEADSRAVITDQRDELIADLPAFAVLAAQLIEHLDRCKPDGEMHGNLLHGLLEEVGMLIADKVPGGLAREDAIRACDSFRRTLCALTKSPRLRGDCNALVAAAKAFLRSTIAPPQAGAAPVPSSPASLAKVTPLRPVPSKDGDR